MKLIGAVDNYAKTPKDNMIREHLRLSLQALFTQ
jgi:hypothetical protein